MYNNLFMFIAEIIMNFLNKYFKKIKVQDYPGLSINEPTT